MSVRTNLVVLGTGLALGVSAAAAGETRPGEPVVLAPQAVEWSDAPPSLPDGAEAAVLAGTLDGEGSRTFRLRFPDGYRVPPHSHPMREHITVIDGTLMLGLGETEEREDMRPLGAGAFHVLPVGDHHYVRAEGETIVQVQGVGPFGIEYVDPEDDPRTSG